MADYEDPRVLAKNSFKALKIPGEAGVFDGSVTNAITEAFQGIADAKRASIPYMKEQVSKLPQYFKDNADRRLSATKYPEQETYGILASVLDAHDQAKYLLENPAKLTEWNRAPPASRGSIVHHLDSRNVDMPGCINEIAHGYLVSLGKAVADPVGS